MGNEAIIAIKKKLAEMKKFEAVGFSDPAKAAEYFQDKEIILEEIAKSLETVTAGYEVETEALKSSVKSLRDELKGQSKYPKELTQKELFYQVGRGLAAVWVKNNSLLAEMGYTPNFKATSWTNPKDVTWALGKGWQVQRTGMGDAMGDMSSGDKFLIHPSYEREVISIAEKKSVMMPLVSHSPMMVPTKIIPVEEAGDVNLEWETEYGQERKDTKPPGIENVELKAYTLAGYIPFYEEFEEDAFIDLGELFVRKFCSAYAKEFDRQCLTANADPFTGALASNRAVSVVNKGASIDDLTWEDFRETVYKIPEEERRDCAWFLHETVVNHVMNLKDGNGNPIVRRPMEKMPGVIDLYPYHECHIMPQFSSITAGKPFAVFMSPQRIEHGNRRGIELKRFDETTESLKYGKIALRFRKRDGFVIAAPKNHMVILKTKTN
jgi:HK97 family phage major capsid protein